MSALTDVVSVTVTAATSNPTQPGFGVALILSWTAAWAERVREYTDLTAVGVDFATTTGEYQAAAKYFMQNPRPERVLIGRAALKPTQRYEFTPTVVNSNTYRLQVNGQTLSFTSDGTATATEIIAGLKAAIDALALPITVTDQVTFMRVVANTPGYFFSMGTTDANLVCVQNHADPGVATDLAAIAIENNNWYGLLTTQNSYAVASAAAAYAESNGKLYLVQTVDTANPNTVLSGTDDISELIKGNAYKKSAAMYSREQSDFEDAAAMGREFPYTPGETTLNLKTLAGVLPGSYTATQIANMKAKNCNFYDTTAGVGTFQTGITGSGQFIDFIRYLDYQQAMIQTDLFALLQASKKVPFDDRGIAQVEGVLRARLQADELRGVLASGWSVSVPKAASISSANKAARLLPSVTYSCVYTGAIHRVAINGTVSL